MGVKEAIILAGGFGTRLAPLTYTRPKPLLPILNKPMISYIINQLPKETKTVIIASNYRNEQLEEFFKKNSFNRDVLINPEPETLGTGGAVKFAEKHITGDFFVLNGDVISSLNMEKMVKFHENNKGFATISLWPVEDVSEFGVVEIKGGVISKFVEKPKPEEAPSNLINAGTYLFEPEIFDYINPGFVSMEKEVFPEIINNGKRFIGFTIDDFWIDVGRIKSYLEVNKLLMNEKNLNNVIGDNCKIEGIVEKSTIGKNVKIGENSVVKNSVIFDNVLIGENVEINESVIGKYVKIDSNSKIINSVVGDEEKIKGVIENKKIWTRELPKNYPKKQIGNEVM